MCSHYSKNAETAPNEQCKKGFQHKSFIYSSLYVHKKWIQPIHVLRLIFSCECGKMIERHSRNRVNESFGMKIKREVRSKWISASVLEWLDSHGFCLKLSGLTLDANILMVCKSFEEEKYLHFLIVCVFRNDFGIFFAYQLEWIISALYLLELVSV